MVLNSVPMMVQYLVLRMVPMMEIKLVQMLLPMLWMLSIPSTYLNPNSYVVGSGVVGDAVDSIHKFYPSP